MWNSADLLKTINFKLVLMFSIASRYLPDIVLQKCTQTYFKVIQWKNFGYNGVHSQTVTEILPKMKVKILPALSDNYMYLIIDEDTKEAAIVDPVAPETVLKAVEEENVQLKKILTTHHHWDHAGGNEDMVKKVPNLEVYGGDDRIGALTHKVKMGDKFSIGKINVECLFTPCHTTGHICYVLDDGGDSSSVFTGDTLFSAGCGRFFEGTAEQMFRNLIEVLGKLPDNTKVFCGHEYTLQNLRFAKHVEPNNVDIQQRIEWCQEKREKGEPTVPSTIGVEKLINPFMRVGIPSVQEHTQKDNLVDVMHALRKEKDNFKQINKNT